MTTTEPKPSPMFAGAKPPPAPEPGDKPADKVTALKQDGVPASRFGLVVGVAALGLLVAGLWSVSHTAALIVGAAAVALILVAFLVHSTAKRRVSTTTKTNPDGSVSTTTRPQKRQPRNPRQPRGDRSVRHPFGGGPGRTPGGGRSGSPGGGGRGRNGGQPGGGGRPRGSGQADLGRNGRPRTAAERATGRNRPTAAQRAERRAAGPGRVPAGGPAPAGRTRGTGRPPAAGKAPAGGKAPGGRSRNPFSRSGGSRPNGGKPGGGGSKSPTGKAPTGSKPNGSKPSGGNGGGRSALHPFGGVGGGKRNNNGGSGPKPTKPRIPGTSGEKNPFSTGSWWGDRKKNQKDPSKQSRRQWWFGPNKPAEGAKDTDKGKGPEATKPTTPAATTTPTARPNWRQRFTRKPKAAPGFDQAAFDQRWESRFGKKAAASTSDGAVPRPPKPAAPSKPAHQMADEAALMSGANVGAAPARPADHMAEEAALMSGEMWEPPKTRRAPSAPASKGGTVQMSETSGAEQNKSTPQSQASSWNSLGNASSRMSAAYTAVANQKRGEAQRAAGMKGMEAASANAAAEAGRASQDAATYGGMTARFRQFAAKVAGDGR